MPSNREILLIEDNKSTINLMEQYLSHENYKTISAENGKKGLQMAVEQSPDLILLDIVLPDISGYEVSKFLSEDPETQEIPYLFVTGNEEVKKVGKAFDHGCFDYIRKPFHREELLARVDHALQYTNYRQELEREIDEQTKALQYKNSALHEVIERLEDRHDSAQSELYHQIIDLVIPHITKLERNLEGDNKKHIDLIKNHLDEIFENETVPFARLRGKLTEREFEICEYIRDGQTSKEIAKTLNLSVSTIKNHRKNIREKLDLNGASTYLKDHLQKIKA